MAIAAREWRRRRSGEGAEWRRSGGAGRRLDRVVPVGWAAAATLSAYGRHVAGAGWSKASASARGRGGVGRTGERVEREAGRPSSTWPLSLLFEFLFSIILPNLF